jgi:hypothetical protein
MGIVKQGMLFSCCQTKIFIRTLCNVCKNVLIKLVRVKFVYVEYHMVKFNVC